MTDEANAAEARLADDAVRKQVHSADEFEAFRKPESTANVDCGHRRQLWLQREYGEKRLTLARVSPLIIEAYRSDEIGLEHV